MRKKLLSLIYFLLLYLTFENKAQTIDFTPKNKNSKLRLGLSDILGSSKANLNLNEATIHNFKSHRFKDGNSKILVDAITSGDGRILEKELSKFGIEIVARNQNTITCWVEIKQMETIVAKTKNLLWMQSTLKPKNHAGAVQTQGDSAQRSNLARTLYGVTGVGIKVGVLSDSYNSLGDAAASIIAGELPGIGNPNGKLTPVTVLSDLGAGGTDEGRAMLEIIHDIAPDAELYFHTAYNGEASFANGIKALANAGCKVIVDDVSYFTEPIFQDGLIAQAIEYAVNVKGAEYFSSAGNEKDQSYEAPYQSSFYHPFGATNPETAHNFGTAVNPVYFLPIVGQVELGLQWDEPSITAGNGSSGSASDLNLYIMTRDSITLDYSVESYSNFNNIGSNPIESAQSYSSGTKYIMITKRAGTSPTRVKIYDFSRQLSWSMTPTNIVGIRAGTIHGHHNATSDITCGAADYRKTPAYGISPPVIESYSSKGGTPIIFTPSGIRLTTPDDRLKPVIVAPDKGNTSFFAAGYDPDADGKPNFAGTSASAPHAGAVAALMLQGNPSLTFATLKTALINSATDMDDPATPTFDAGFDYKTGNGLIQADIAIGTTLNPNCPTITVTTVGATIFCEGDSVILNSSIGTGYSFQWHKNDILINGATQSQFIAKESGIYNASVSRGGCTINSNKLTILKNIGTPKPTTISKIITVGTPITTGNGLQSNIPNCPTELTQTYAGPTVGYDNNLISGINPTVTFSGIVNSLAKVKVSITWRKKQNGNQTDCGNVDGLGNPFNDEVSFKIKAPNGSIITLLTNGTYVSGGTPAGVVTTVFEDGAASIGTVPASGTFNPFQNLFLFNGISPNGIWELLPNDNSPTDPLCVQGFSVTISTNGTGTPSVITWHNASLAGTQVGTGIEFIPSNTTVGTYTYYAQATCPILPNCSTSIRTPARLTIDCITTPNTPSIPPSVSICSNSTASISAACSLGVTTWYDANPSTILFTGSPFITPILSTNTSYKVRCESGICVSSLVNVLVNVNTSSPTITSFSSMIGAIGSSVNIIGTNFNAIANQNIVYFGATQANVTLASATNLAVNVPLGATFEVPSVLNLCTALSSTNVAPFKVTFPGFIGTNSFDPKSDFMAGALPISITVGDLNNDGKSDLVVANFNSGTVSVYQNTSMSGSITASSFATKIDFVTGTNPKSVSIGDLDGDGKPDLAVGNYSGSISILRNTSTGGNITNSSFAAKVDFTASSLVESIKIGDLDGDGKPDLVVCNNAANTVSVFRNTSISGSLSISSFAPKVDFITGVNPNSVQIGDLDGDRKLDLAITNYGSNTVSILRNIASIGTINLNSFVAKVDYPTGISPSNVAIGDLDADGKTDLVVVNYGSNSVSVFRNTSTNGIGSFAFKIDFTTGIEPIAVGINDLDGDGKLDLVVTNSNVANNSISVFRNTSTIGNISASSFATKIDYSTGSHPYSLCIGDLDNDGLPDMAVVNFGSNNISILRNNLKPPQGSLTANGAFCGSGTGQLTWTATFGTSPYIIVYNDGTANRTATNILSGTPFNVFTNPVNTTKVYTLISVTDANNIIRNSGFTSNLATIFVNQPPTPTAQINTSIPTGGSITLTATGCSGSPGTYTLKWYKSNDNSLITMPVSPTSMTDYYAKCEQTANSITCTSSKTTDVSVFVGNVVTSIINGNWENTATWDLSRIPLSSDFVIINNNHTVTITGSNAKAKNVEYKSGSVLKFNSAANNGNIPTQLKVGSF
jgi:Subtilase family/FG-GAP-like repeat/Ig-like domain CHU_C associated